MAGCNGCDVQLSGRSNIELLPAFAGEPIACSLAGAELSGRAREFQAQFAWLTSRERLPGGGIRWTFQSGPGVERAVRQLARREHLCCPFLGFAISTQDDLVIWETRGPADGQDVVDEFARLPELSAEPERALLQLTRRATN